MIKLCVIRLLLLGYILFQGKQSGSCQITASTDYFRSVSSGTWNSTLIWESSSDGTSNWIPATLVPTNVASVILVRNGHSVAIINNTVLDQVVVANGGVLELATGPSTIVTVNDGTGNDIIVQSGGILKHNISGSQLPAFTAFATLQLQKGGILEVANNNGLPSEYANPNSAISQNILWADSSVFNWNTLGNPTDGITYFSSGTAIPIFRISQPVSFGNTIPTIINGLLEANANVDFRSTGTKTIRNGITGPATVAATAASVGQFIINGSTAVLGGGILVLPDDGMSISPGTEVTLVSNKTINKVNTTVSPVNLLGALICGEHLIDGSAKIVIEGTLKTANPNGLTGSYNTTFVTGFNVNLLGNSSTVEYNRRGQQVVTPLSFTYQNLIVSGAGVKTAGLEADMLVSGNLSILSGATFALNGAKDLKLNGGGILNINSNAVFDTGGESQVSGGSTPTINIYGTFITRDADGFAGAGTSIPGATSTNPSVLLNIYAGATIEYGSAGDQQITSRNDYKNLTFSGSGIKTIPTCAPFGTVTIKDNVIADASNKTFGDANTNLTMVSGRLKVGGIGTKPDISGIYDLAGGVIEFTNSSSTAQTIRSPRNYFNIIISGSNVKNGAGIITLVAGGSFTVKSGGSFDNNSSRIEGVSGTQTVTLETGATFKTGVSAGFSGSMSASPYPALNNIEIIAIDPKSTIIYSRAGDQTVTPLTGSYPTLLLKGSGIKTVINGTVHLAATADSLVIDPLVVFKVNSGAKSDFNHRPVFIRSNQGGTGAIGEVAEGSSGLLNATNVTIERYIPARRAFRFLTSAVTTASSIKANWMEGQNNPPPAYSKNNNSNPGYGTHITGSADPGDGFDATATNNPSLFTFDHSKQSWSAAANTNSTLRGGEAYRLLIRGSRSTDLSNNSAIPSITILRATGTTQSGTVVYDGSTTPSINSITNYFSLLGNPYPSPVDWDALEKPNLSPYYYVWDPNLNTRGAYATYGYGTTNPVSSQINKDIQSGQAFFVRSIGANPSLVFKEGCKTTINRNVFRTSASFTSLAIQLLLDSTGEEKSTADGVTVLFDDHFTTSLGNEDARKINNLDENISISRNGISLSVEGRPAVLSVDSIQLQMLQFRRKVYFLKFYPKNFPAGMTAFVKDNFLKKETVVDLTAESLLPFEITNDSASFAFSRFIIFFTQTNLLPIIIRELKAFKKESGVQVEWVTETETGIDRYEVEKSVNGQQYKKAGTVAPRANGGISERYSHYDDNVISGNNCYRVLSIAKSGVIKYSRQVCININAGKGSCVVFPNPAKGNAIAITMSNMKKSVYNIAIINSSGQKVYAGLVQYNGTTETIKIFTGKVLSRGSYLLEIKNEFGSFTEKLQFE